ncbi:ATP-dependent RNA helicase, mitochondrial precursor, putative [Candida dubliniensis CD36]|uniref:ATP-dependent RNA helicase SUV3, mitochondrial n=1 Tax=Candida dubliniensis (strain CD36 / ATCC MYA-646 / CBS 7987 / NCPF 3949 / NRRL Y-17841) TaxID=573826 RepID=B9WBB0_CANDC|nr:ATP-dependent RNA helicase, mitochondrial precursor, putative [Candida dubliniensis CD36]CAX43680.1 ATP-dependent RNA helicase, mitochondrial precursor, putative [Candida dubliniensis CD36]
MLLLLSCQKPTYRLLRYSIKKYSTSLYSLRGSTRVNLLHRTYATSIAEENINHGDSSPILNNNNKVQLENIKYINTLIHPILLDLNNKLIQGKFDSPYSILNNQPLDVKTAIFKSFEQQLTKALFSKSIPENKITLVDYLNPTLDNIPSLLQLISTNTYPNNFLEFNNLSSNNELIMQLFTQLLHKIFLQYRIENASFEKAKVDFSNPAEWFPEARKMKRKIIMHVGPTNSGKTYNSLIKLSKSKTGYYAGPLRLLAREIYEKFNSQGIGCNLITGEEVVPSIDKYGKVSGIASGTIEMIPLHKKMDLCVIDEIQMISDPLRGSVWTNAVLGVLAHEIHLCGEESAVPFIQKMVKITGDELEIKKFDRLGKLTVEKSSINLLQLKKGDCLVVFSKKKILKYKCDIERNTRLKVGVIYGALPPEIRSQEASKFNNGEYDVLVASDAIGMGLNLKINRIVFSGVNKFNGSTLQKLSVSQVKQIAGRAGRFSAQHGSKEGFVTALHRSSLVYINQCLKTPVSEILKASIWPTNGIWRQYMANNPKKNSLSSVYENFLTNVLKFQNDNFFISELDQKVQLLNLVSKDRFLSTMIIDDQLTISETPISFRTSNNPKLLQNTVIQFYKTIVKRDCKSILDFGFLDLELLSQTSFVDTNVMVPLQKVEKLEDMHKLVLLFLWLSQRFPTLFIDKDSAMEVKALVEKRINQELVNVERANSFYSDRLKGY